MVHDPRLLKSEATSCSRVVVVAEAQLDFTKHVVFVAPVDNVPLPGKWKISIEGRHGAVIAEFEHKAVGVGTFGSSATYTVSLDLYLGTEWLCIAKNKHKIRGPLPAKPSKTSFVCSTTQEHVWDTLKRELGVVKGTQRYCLRLELDCFDARVAGDTLLARTPTLDLIANPHDVCLSFPRYGGELWTRSDVLARLSPYFKTLLSSGFADSVSVPAKRARTAGQKRAVAVPRQEEEDSNDSDDETDQLYFANNPLDGNKDDEDEAVGAYKKVTITGSAFTTYRAVLAYLRTGYVAFAPLSSTCSPVSDSGSRQTYLLVATAVKPNMPYPASPKSVFRLAHLLELEDLQRLCLSEVQQTLKPSSAAHELFDEVSVLHEAWRRVVIEYVVANWDAVHATKGWKEVERRDEEEEVPGAAKIMVQLSRAREKARG